MPTMRHLPTVLLVLALPVGLIGYFVGAAVVNAVAPGAGILTIFVSLLVAGLFMIPFIAPWLDRKAKADLAAIQERRRAEALEAGAGEPPGDQGEG
jgi:NhaP-type Na+/H+ or K+/H+ antiporter